MIALIPQENVHEMIYLIRGQKVMLDRELATLYRVGTGALNRAVKRNRERFPDDFMFQLTGEEWENLKCQIGTSRWGGDRRALPHVFTEQGVAMLSSVLSSPRAIAVNIEVMRAFVRLREVLAGNKDLPAKLTELERKLKGHDQAIAGLIDAIRRLTSVPAKPSRPIGFTADLKDRKP